MDAKISPIAGLVTKSLRCDQTEQKNSETLGLFKGEGGTHWLRMGGGEIHKDVTEDSIVGVMSVHGISK